MNAFSENKNEKKCSCTRLNSWMLNISWIQAEKNGYKKPEVVNIQLKQVNWNEVDANKNLNKKFIFEREKKKK